MNQDKRVKTEDTTKGNTPETRPLEGEVKCFKCGTIHTYESLLDGGRCTQCKVELIGELF